MDSAECLIRRLNKTYESLKIATRKYDKTFAHKHFNSDEESYRKQKILELSSRCNFFEKEITKLIAKDDLELMHWLETERKYDMLHISYGLGKKFSKPHSHIIINLRKCFVYYNRAKDEPHGHQNYVKYRAASNY